MLQVIQHQKTGVLSVELLPDPVLRPGGVLVANRFSLISPGTEKTSIETAKASLIGKAKSRPDLVRQVLDNVQKEGVVATYEKVQNRLNNFKELGYSSAGVVLESSVPGFTKGDRVACAGGGYAVHAEKVFVPANLAARIPDSVTFEEASATTLCSIAMHGVRRAEVQIGETVVVIGLGLIGLITVQLLKAGGCRVFGIDVSDANFKIAKNLGCDLCLHGNEESIRVVESLSHGIGADAVIITAGTASNEPVERAISYARKKSKIVVVGAVGMNIPRSPFYEKELDLRISCSYGPGRYDRAYEEGGMDYPVGYVRWTENRNMIAVLDLLQHGKLTLKPLLAHTFAITDALKAYELLEDNSRKGYVGILLEYPPPSGAEAEGQRRVTLRTRAGKTKPISSIVIGAIGAGNFAQSNLFPVFKELNVRLKGVVTSTPVKAKSAASKFGFEFCSSDATEILIDPEINTVIISTRHDSHANYVIESLAHGKHVFVEKPLSITVDELEAVRTAFESAASKGLLVRVGFNRRFSRPFKEIEAFLGASRSEPIMLVYRVNAGLLAGTHWLHQPSQGGRVLGEVCHFVDCAQFLISAAPVRVHAVGMPTDLRPESQEENVNATITFADGSIASIIYVANGDSSVPKEYCEVSSGGKTAVFDNFRSVSYHSAGRVERKKYDGTKGHHEEVVDFIRSISEGETGALPFAASYNATQISFAILESIRKGSPIEC